MVDLYDETRVFNVGCFNLALDFLVKRFPPQTFNRVLEPGIGTGRIAIPLAERGYRIIGVDISGKMLGLLKKQMNQLKRPLPLSFQIANVTELPFRTATFDAAVVVHLFYFIREWKKAVQEILRAVKNDGPVILMHTGTGTEIPFLNQRYKDLCANQGCLIPDVGVKSTSEVVDYCSSLSYHAEWIRDRWKWASHIRLDKALYYLKSRAYSFTIVASNHVHTNAIERLESELQHQFDSLRTEVECPNQVYLVVITK